MADDPNTDDNKSADNKSADDGGASKWAEEKKVFETTITDLQGKITGFEKQVADFGKEKEKLASAWRDGIEDKDARAYADKFASPADLTTNAMDLRKKLSNAVVRPGKDAKPEEVAAFRKAMGVPDTADKYDLAPANGLAVNDEFKKTMSSVFLEAGISVDQAKALNGAWNSFLVAQQEQTTAARKTALTAAEARLKKEWPGEEYAQNVNFAKGAAKAFGGEEFLSWVETAQIDGVSVGNRPEFLRVFSAIGRRMGEDTLHLGTSSQDKADLQGQISAKRAELGEARRNHDQKSVDRLNGELQNLYAKAHPGRRQF